MSVGIGISVAKQSIASITSTTVFDTLFLSFVFPKDNTYSISYPIPKVTLGIEGLLEWLQTNNMYSVGNSAYAYLDSTSPVLGGD